MINLELDRRDAIILRHHLFLYTKTILVSFLTKVFSRSERSHNYLTNIWRKTVINVEMDVATAMDVRCSLFTDTKVYTYDEKSVPNGSRTFVM